MAISGGRWGGGGGVCPNYNMFYFFYFFILHLSLSAFSKYSTELIYFHTGHKKIKLKGFHPNGDQVSFQNTLQNLFVSRQVTKELKIGRLSPVWRPSPFLKYSTKFICFHTGHKRMENWKAFTKYLFKILNQIYLFPHHCCYQEKWIFCSYNAKLILTLFSCANPIAGA